MLLCVMLALLSVTPIFAQEHVTPAETATVITNEFILRDGTPLKLKLTESLSSATTVTDEEITFEVLEDVLVLDKVVIARGSSVIGTVLHAQAKRRLGRAGKLNVAVDSARLTTGGKVSLRGVKERNAGGNQGKMTAAMVGTALVFWPAAPLFLLVHGKDITIPKGTHITAFVDGDMVLNPSKYKPVSTENQ